VVFWLALAAWLVLTLAGVAFVVVRGLRLWRTAKRSASPLTAELEEISRKTEQIEMHLARAEESGGRLREATARLAGTRARLDVQLRAVREARATVEAALPLLQLLRR
jgi:chromosome segregation ATPase